MIAYAAAAAKESKVRATVTVFSKIVNIMSDTLIVISRVVSALCSFRSHSGPRITPIPMTVMMLEDYGQLRLLRVTCERHLHVEIPVHLDIVLVSGGIRRVPLLIVVCFGLQSQRQLCNSSF